MALTLKSVKVKTLKYHIYNGAHEAEHEYNAPEQDAKKLVANGKVEYIKPKSFEAPKDEKLKLNK